MTLVGLVKYVKIVDTINVVAITHTKQLRFYFKLYLIVFEYLYNIIILV